MATIGDRIRSRRLARGLTQYELAELCGTSQPTVAVWESGRQIPKTDTLQRIADALRVKISALLEDEEERSGA